MSEHKHTPTPWEANTFTKPDGSPIETVEDVAITTAFSAMKGSVAELWGITSKGDESNPPKVIAYTGNGPTRDANAIRIVHCINTYDALVSALEKADKALTWWGPSPESCDTSEQTAVWQEIRAAIASTKEGNQ